MKRLLKQIKMWGKILENRYLRLELFDDGSGCVFYRDWKENGKFIEIVGFGSLEQFFTLNPNEFKEDKYKSLL